MRRSSHPGILARDRVSGNRDRGDFARALAYRFGVTNPDGRFLVEQQAYLFARDGQIEWMRVLCSGFRERDPQVR
jgi:hypothetical protein